MGSKIESGLKMAKSLKIYTSHTKTLLLRVQGLQNRTPNRSKIGSKSHLRRGGLQKASGEPLGALLEASGAEIKKLGTALGRVGPQKGAKTGARMGAKNAPRCLQEPKRLQEAAREPFRINFRANWAPFQLDFGMCFCIMLDSLQISEHVFWFSFKLYSSTSTSGMLSARWPASGAHAPCEIRPPSSARAGRVANGMISALWLITSAHRFN